MVSFPILSAEEKLISNLSDVDPDKNNLIQLKTYQIQPINQI